MLLVKDVDVLASSRLVDTFIQAAEPRFDLIIACGPLSHRDIKTDGGCARVYMCGVRDYSMDPRRCA
jgi:hypothetical protein